MLQKNTLHFCLFFVACAFIMLVNLSGWDLTYPDETRYAQIAREMIETGQYIIPHLNAEIYPDKPPLLFWLIALASKPFGDVTTFAARLPSALATLGGILLVYLFARKLYGPQAALLASLILFTSRKFFNVGLSVHFDPLLTFWITLALLLFYCGYEKQNGARKYFLLSYVSIGCALLTKGPAGFAIPLITIVLFLILKRDLSKIKKLELGKGSLIILGMLALWLVPACILGGAEYTQNVLFKQTFGRMVKSFAHKEPFYYYLLKFPSDFLPWSVFIPAAGIHFWRNRTKNNNVLFPAAWFAATFLLFSLVSGKRSLYLLPLYPAAALIMAKFFGDLLRMEASDIPALQKRFITIPSQLLFGALAASCAVIMIAPAGKMSIVQKLAPAQPVLFPVALLGVTVSVGAILYIQKKPDIRYIMRALMLSFMVTALVTVLSIFPAVENTASVAPFCAKIRALVGPDDTLLTSFDPERLNYSLHRYPIPIVIDRIALEKIFQSSETIYYLALKNDYENMPEQLKNMLTLLEQGQVGHSKVVYLLVNKADSVLEAQALPQNEALRH